MSTRASALILRNPLVAEAATIDSDNSIWLRLRRTPETADLAENLRKYRERRITGIIRFALGQGDCGPIITADEAVKLLAAIGWLLPDEEEDL